MMEKLIKDNLPLFQTFTNKLWNDFTNVDDIEKTLQSIINKIAESFNFPDVSCQIKIKSFKDPKTKGLFDSKTKTLFLEHDLFVKKLKSPYYYNDRPIINTLANKECFEVLMHEFCHALQDYYTEQQLFDKQNILILNKERSQNKEYYAYFNINVKNPKSALLYILQPLERDAFLFADDLSNKFNNVMRVLFPHDLSFSQHDRFSDFWFNTKLAEKVFNTQTPFDDIDDIIRHINGIEPLKPLNEEMWKAVQDSQKKELKGRFLGRFFDEEINHTHEEELDLIEEECGDREL